MTSDKAQKLKISHYLKEGMKFSVIQLASACLMQHFSDLVSGTTLVLAARAWGSGCRGPSVAVVAAAAPLHLHRRPLPFRRQVSILSNIFS